MPAPAAAAAASTNPYLLFAAMTLMQTAGQAALMGGGGRQAQIVPNNPVPYQPIPQQNYFGSGMQPQMPMMSPFQSLQQPFYQFNPYQFLGGG